MNISELKNKIEEKVQNGTLTLKAAALSSPNIQQVINDYFSNNELIITDAQVSASDSSVTVNGKIDFLSISNVGSSAVFSIIDAEAALELTVPLSAGWTFSQSFPTLKGGLLDDLVMSVPEFLLISHSQAKPEILKKGLNFQGQITHGLPEPVSHFLSGTVSLSGAIQLEKNGPKVDLWLSKSINLDFGTLKLPAVTCGLSTLPVPLAPGTGVNKCYQIINFASNIPISKDQLSISGSYSIFNKSLIIDASNQSLPLSAGIQSIFKLIGWTPDITWPSDTFLDDICLNSLSLITQFDPVSLQSFSFGIECNADWAFIPNKVELEKICVGIWINDPLIPKSRTYGGQIYGQFLLGRKSGAVIDLYAQMSPSGTKHSWTFSGSTQPGTKIDMGSVFLDIQSKFGITLPKVLLKFILKDIDLEFNTASSEVSGYLTVDFMIDNKPIEIVITTLISKSGSSYLPVVTGKMLIGTSLFNFTFSAKDEVTIKGKWSDPANPLEFSDIAIAFGFTPPDIPEGLDLGLTSAELTYDFTNSTLVIEADSKNYGKAVFVAYKNSTTEKWQFYFGLLIGKSINLSNLPLIDKVLSDKEKIEISGLQVVVGSAPLIPGNKADKKEIDLINNLIGKDYPNIPAQGLPGTIALSAQFDFGGMIIPLNIGTPAKKTHQTLQSGAALQEVSDTFVGTASGSNQDTVPQPVKSADGATWFKIQKNFGPVNFQKIGVKYKDGVLWFLIDASITAAGLQISVIGLSVGSPLSTFSPEFNIEGLGIDYSNASVTISGAFDKLPAKAPVTLEFSGSATIQLEEFGISAVGAYSQFDNQTSMFVFANIEGSFGGPGFFFVTGFCGGFGYNSKLRIPSQDEIYQYPFVASLSDPKVFGKNPSPTSALQKIMGGDKPWVAPSVGDIWMSVGVKFTTYKLVNSTALVVAEFGDKFLLSLIGLSQARFPMEGPTVYAYVELQLEAIFNPGEGIVSFSAVLSPNSYVLDKACHLTGGFALYFWYGPSQYAGDFVLTLGGYSPYFNPPAHYPLEPRLGFNWALDTSISISGGLYFALTPAAVMAGGDLSATYHSGNLKAWFDMYADIIIWYNPFHFIADIGINVGASYKVDLLFCSATISVELGADLTLWGPATGGTVTVHWFVISFTVGFGAGISEGKDKQLWSDFIKVLPSPDDAVKIVPLTGLLGGPVPAKNGDGSTLQSEKAEKPWIVRADSFQFTTNSSVPLTELYIGTDKKPVKTGSTLNIKPMKKTALTSKKTLTIVNKETGDNVLDSTWGIEFVTSSVPSALWGTGSPKELPGGDQLVADQLAGFQIKVPAPSLGTGTGKINIKEDLQYDPLYSGKNPLKQGLESLGPVPTDSLETIADIEQIMSVPVKNQRDAIYNTFTVLSLYGLTNSDLTDLAAHAGAMFSSEPLLIKS